VLAAPDLGAQVLVPVPGAVAGYRVETTVDSEVARYYVENYLAGARKDPGLDRRFDALHRDRAPPTRERLAAIAAEFSVDVAAAYYAQRLLQEPPNRALQSRFEAELAAVRAGAPAALAPAPLILMAPGWLYVTQPETGADFARPRAVLRRLGLASELVPTHESGTIEENAAIIAQAITRHSAAGRDLVLVSASKAGPEVGWALTLLADQGTPHRARAWVNIGGILQGSPLADQAMRWPLRWAVRIAALWNPWTIASIRSMRTPALRERYARWRRPPDMTVINFLGVPLSGHITPGADTGYAELGKLGPNDGLTLLTDAIAPASTTIVQLGLDHYYLDPEIDLKTAALARVALAPRSR
jgi:hypothetical protein